MSAHTSYELQQFSVNLLTEPGDRILKQSTACPPLAGLSVLKIRLSGGINRIIFFTENCWQMDRCLDTAKALCELRAISQVMRL